MNPELYKKITEKKEFSRLPKKDVEKVFGHFKERNISDLEKIKFTRELLHKIFGAFGSRKLLNLKYKSPEWVLKKHLSSRERFHYYKNIYSRVLAGEKKRATIIDLGSGVNGFSYDYFKKIGFKIKYVAVESMGQIVDLMNLYFKKNKLNAEAIQLSLFDLEKVKNIISSRRSPKIVFLLKVIDSLEMVERDYSKNLLLEITPISDKVVMSFATKSMVKRKKFFANRSWIIDFVKSSFNFLDDFEFEGERFLIFKKK